LTVEIREYRVADHDRVVELSLAAWAPVFASVETVLGEALSHMLHGEDWRTHQVQEVRHTIGDPSHTVWVADEQGQISGFVAAKVADETRNIGEISMLAVDPPRQRCGIGLALTEHATTWLRGIGMRVVTIGTGGDTGHAAARQLYERAGYSPFPIVRYFRAL
jgi:GNAT superfamily N-acetyltransferase